MKRIFIVLYIILTSCLIYAQDIGGDFYVAVWGDDSNPGTYDLPWGTWQKAFKEALPGDTVYIRGGVYFSYERNQIDPEAHPDGCGNSGTRVNPICYFGYPGEWPILDCIYHCDSIPDQGWDIYNQAINIANAQYIHFKDFEVRNVFQCDSVTTGAIGTSSSANLTFEHIIMHNIGQRGYWIQGGAWGEYTQDPPPKWESDTTRWINCDVYDLFDTLRAEPGNSADAWKTIHYKGNYLVWDGCRAWNYSDDGYDPTPVDGAERVFHNCWAMASNKYYDPGAGWLTERNGFKLNSAHPEGGTFDVHSIVMTNCLAVFCTQGIYEIGGTPSNGIYYNNTSAFNGIGYSGGSKGYNNVYKNNIVYGSKSISATGKPYECSLPSDYTESHNTWDKVENYPWFVYASDSVTVSDEDFITVDSLTIVSLFTADRQADGSLPSFRPFMLAPGSDLIDAGTDVGSSYIGSGPDMGAYEYDELSGNQSPQVIITSPSDDHSFIKPVDIDIQAYAYDPDGSVSKVEFFYMNLDSLIGVAFSAPWSITWFNPPVGFHTLRAVATDDEGKIATSSKVDVKVLPAISDPDPGDEEIGADGLLYPNPNNGSFTIFLTEALEETGQITISSFQGQIVCEETILPSEVIKQFDFPWLPSGFYILTLSSKEILFTTKFFKL